MKKIILLIFVALLVFPVSGVEAGKLKKPPKSTIVENVRYYCKVKTAYNIYSRRITASYDFRRYYESLDPKTLEIETYSFRVGRYDSKKERWPVKMKCVVKVKDYNGRIYKENAEIKVYYYRGEFDDYDIFLPRDVYEYSKTYRAKYSTRAK
ncbi:hypothetical protein BMS3Abin15_00923 [bacterium BMS3Abin15]|nr:hypothetical protein BMS3Abin15_00923 [bacterium BMS3Abin15]HDZ85406.1 hypothetical protein [Candidatus Moranbacteria bacterium]